MSTPTVHSLQRQYEIARTKTLDVFISELNDLLSAKSALTFQFRLTKLAAGLKSRRSALRVKNNDTMSPAIHKFYESVDLIPEHFNTEMDPIGHFIRSETHCKQLINEVGFDILKGFIMLGDERIFEVALAKTIGYYFGYNLCLEVIELVEQGLLFVDKFKRMIESGSSAISRMKNDLGFRTPGEKKQLLEYIEAELSAVNSLINRFRSWNETVKRRETVYEILSRTSVQIQLQADLGLAEELKDDLRSLYDEAEAMSTTSSASIRVLDGVSRTDVLRVFHAMMDSKMIHKVSGTALSTIVETVTTSNWDNLKSRIVHDPKLIESDALQKFLISLLNQTSNSFVDALIAKLYDRLDH